MEFREPRSLAHRGAPDRSRQSQLKRNRLAGGQRDYALVGVGLFCGLRVSELVNLKDVDLESARLRVRHGKGDKDRELPIVPPLRGMLRAYLSRAADSPPRAAALVRVSAAREWGGPAIDPR